MKLLRLAVEATGADYAQWRGLVRPLMKTGFRGAPSAEQIAKQSKRPKLVPWMMRFMMLFVGLFIAALCGFLPGLFLFSLVALSGVALFVFFMLLQDFQAVAVSPLDHQVLGHRPVSPRTYLLTRLTVTMAHEGLVSSLLVGPSVIVCGFRFGWLPAAGLLLATGLMVLGLVLALIAMYSTLIDKVGADKLKRVLAYSQLLLSCVYLVPLLLQERAFAVIEAMDGVGLEGWLVALPTAWFAAFASLFSGSPGPGEWLGAGAAVASCGGLGWLARDKLSLSSAQKLGATLQAQSREHSERGRPARPGIRFKRLNATATLIRGQFRHDTQFRMGAFALLPLFVIYLFLTLREPGTVDPFVSGATVFPLFGIHFAVLAAPVMYLEMLFASESYRAGWIFFATPVDRARVASDARHCVTLFLFVPFLVVVAISLAWRFDAIWHGLAHAFLLACVGILAMQVSQYLAPRLPFTLPQKQRRNFVIAGQMALMGLLSGLLGPYTAFAYPRPSWAIGTFAFVAVGVMVMEGLLPRRLNRRLRWLESEG